MQQMRALVMVLGALLVSELYVQQAKAKHASGKVSSKDGFKFLSKFCFDFTPEHNPDPGGWIDITLKADKERSTDIQILLFDDEPSSWLSIYGKGLKCHEKMQTAKNAMWGVPFLYRAVWRDGKWKLPRIPIWEHIRPRFWYIVAANCRGFEDLGYDIQFTNRGSAWEKEFGLNERHLNTIYLISAGAIILIFALHHFSIWKYNESNGYVHPVLKLQSLTVFCQMFGVCLHALNYFLFTYDGEGVPLVALVAQLFVGTARIVFTLLLILLASGWTISTDKIRDKSFIVSGIGAFFGTYTFLVLWDFFGRDPASTLYVYASMPGVCIVLLDLIAGFWFNYVIRESLQEENNEDKAFFYRILWIGFGVWFIFLPILVFIAEFVCDPWNRERVVFSISLSVCTLAYGALTFLLWPSRADNYFAISVPDVANTVMDYANL